MDRPDESLAWPSPGLFSASQLRLRSSTAKTAGQQIQHNDVRPSRSSKKMLRFRRRRILQRMARRTWSLPLFLILLVLASYAANPSGSSFASRLLFLSYRLEETQKQQHGDAPDFSQYGKGPWDLAFVAFYTVVLSFTREFCMHELLRPLARRCGVQSRAKQARFMEQMYTALYIAFAGPFGVWCMSRTPVWYFNTRGMYESYPHRTLDGPLKLYYLVQAAFWVQQALVMVLGLEKRRKDFKELVAHHIATVALIGLSYRFHFTHIGIAVYITHDLSDMALATSKSLNYIDSPLQVPCFVFNIATWIYLRHYVNIRILYSILTEFRTVGSFELNWDAQHYKFWVSQYVTFGLLGVLQLLNLFWLFCLLRAAHRIVFSGIAKDDRSEDEEPEVEGVEDKGPTVGLM